MTDRRADERLHPRAWWPQFWYYIDTYGEVPAYAEGAGYIPVKRDAYEVECPHPGCPATWTAYDPPYPGSGRPRVWCDDHGTPAWAMRRKRAEEKRRGVKILTPWGRMLPAQLPGCCRAIGGEECPSHGHLWRHATTLGAGNTLASSRAGDLWPRACLRRITGESPTGARTLLRTCGNANAVTTE
jgi:hypothetical protein